MVPAFALVIFAATLLRRDPEMPFAAVALLITVRGAVLHRPATSIRVVQALVVLCVAAVAGKMGDVLPADLALLVAAVLACRPAPPPRPASVAERARAAMLVADTRGDPLAPFALRSDKSLVFSPDGAAAIGYRVRFGVAVAGGDPVGATASGAAAIQEFLRLAEANGWRSAALGAGSATAQRWAVHGFMRVPVGRDVVIDVGSFELAGRAFRNLRQAVHRASNAGLAVAVVREGDLSELECAELRRVLDLSGKRRARGFSMMLDGVLDGQHPDSLLVIGRIPGGKIVAVSRFAVAGGGTDLSLDLPWRLPEQAPGGSDEGLAAAVVAWGAANGVQRVSLAFAPFPDLFADPGRSLRVRAVHATVRLLDPLIRLESLYRFLRKFHAFGGRRYALLNIVDLPVVLAALLHLEFSGR